ncbi:MAG: bifunctional molybdenum cofactor biosynthesis protein MoaC/MoaB [Chlorobium sp.]|jgi:cyclic pyranopterin phosphate synthase|uniref:bifunctional molybdenum cofactor biosynthesis protein MoaC/MoaB n=1 Tax=Chlorobium sp. TaxID=1095 RepID=UPI001DFDEB2F|nr:bifunctional molybdenum cofactor biosynthesis protein MoaC/MoaB [Chlorobium sp.]MBN1278686.1 bifunctional molybdenum cofactor biosynthesis protein MoaC/MoaB [Chlorobiaceae bacterium]MCF8216669.1 bifunctional molybdenum cofactor biosynthesis protein MoaC/MoaB [Chlorobium sp.]MCF8270870.1 bifunctional molybdenum cofactor biosynthesis protein MoaC/MoaB [Chlorobium sp.]MCF8287196.1 bifunctional molybdenum cofactor biosynthesis protein MoaC/MoaB [Chlorobium sp.]MCF8290853.1 bifunctional molybden
MEFSHLDERGDIAMVDVSAKPGTMRTAAASGAISMRQETIRLLREDSLPKGNVLTAAKLAGIQAAKKTAHLIPLCHQLNLSWVDISFTIHDDRIAIAAVVKTREATGVEMEALTAVSIAALTIYDMCKAVDKSMEISAVRLDLKTGGKTQHATEYRPRTSILVLSDSISEGKGQDRSGMLLREGFEAAGCPVEDLRIVPDSGEMIASVVDEWVAGGVELIVTSGGTGLGPRDVTVEVLQPKFSRKLPGIEQALFNWGQGKTKTAMLSRLAAGTIGNSLLVCLPGSPGAAADALEVLVPAVFHAFSMLKGEGHA